MTSMLDFFVANIVNAKNSIIDIWQGLEYASLVVAKEPFYSRFLQEKTPHFTFVLVKYNALVL